MTMLTSESDSETSEAAMVYTPSSQSSSHSTASNIPRGPERANNTSEDTRNLGFLLSFLSPIHEITPDFLHWGGSPRKRWTVDGDVAVVDAADAGLLSCLVSLLCDLSRLDRALDDLANSILRKTDQYYHLDEGASSRIRDGLSTPEANLWKRQALIVSYRAIPWKHIELSNFNHFVALPHLQYTATACQDLLNDLGSSTRYDLALALLEASRFPDMAWKHDSIAQAHKAMAGVEDWYLASRFASVKSTFYRLDQQHEAAVQVIRAFHDLKQPDSKNQMENSAIGFISLQQALNYIQVEEHPKAQQILIEWRPIGHEPSLMEQVVAFRMNMILGKILRFQGQFDDSLTRLKTSYALMEGLHDFTFDEDRRDLTCDMADTLRELDEPEVAETYVRNEIARWGASAHVKAYSGISFLEACLAEILFAQGQMNDAERICSDLLSRSRLFKFGRLRACVILAKVHQVRGDRVKAAEYWGKTMNAMGQWAVSNGLTARVVMLSMEKLGCLPPEGLNRSMQQREFLVTLANPGAMRYWIAGMRHWEKYLATLS